MKAIALLLLASAAFGPLASANYGGTPIGEGSSLHQTLAYIGNEKAQFCSGAFVAKDIVLTAAHCVRDADGALAPGDSVYLPGPEGIDPLRGERIRIKSISIHPEKEALDIWLPIGSNQFPFDNPDLALLKLDRPFDRALPARLADYSPAADTWLSFAGFGYGNASWQRPSRLEFRVMKSFSEVAADYADLTEGNTFEFMRALGEHFGLVNPHFSFVRPREPGKQTLCHGDSGAPLFAEENGQVIIYGVAAMFIPHQGKGNEECGGSFQNLFAKVAPFRAWLEREITALSSK